MSRGATARLFVAIDPPPELSRALVDWAREVVGASIVAAPRRGRRPPRVPHRRAGWGGRGGGAGPHPAAELHAARGAALPLAARTGGGGVRGAREQRAARARVRKGSGGVFGGLLRRKLGRGRA